MAAVAVVEFIVQLQVQRLAVQLVVEVARVLLQQVLVLQTLVAAAVVAGKHQDRRQLAGQE
jgi:hypothetical protein